MCDMTLAGKSLSNQLPFESQHEGTWKWKIHERRLYVGILYTDVFFCLVLKVKASMTGYDHLLQCLFASWFGLAIAYLRGEARPQLAKFAFFLLLFVKLQHYLLYTLICFFWSPGTTAPKSGNLERSWKPRRFYVASLEIWAAWDPSRCRRLSRDFIQDLDSLTLHHFRCDFLMYMILLGP